MIFSPNIYICSGLDNEELLIIFICKGVIQDSLVFLVLFMRFQPVIFAFRSFSRYIIFHLVSLAPFARGCSAGCSASSITWYVRVKGCYA